MSRQITDLHAREVLDCRGLPTLHVDLELDESVVGGADVPSGRSTGVNEAVDLRDGGRRYGGYGVLKAVANVNGVIRERLVGMSLISQRELDQVLIHLDGTRNKSVLGANATTGVSLAAARASANYEGVDLFEWLSPTSCWLPVPQVNLINGGRHASNDLEFQEFTIMPVGASSFSEAIRVASEVNLALGSLLLKRIGKAALNTGDEGGYAPDLTAPEEALHFLHEAVSDAGYSEICIFGLDCAASQFYDPDSETYQVNGQELTRSALIEYYIRLTEEFRLESIEDPLQEEDYDGFAELTAHTNIQIIGDDLFVTDTSRLSRGIQVGAANSLLWKFNQVGTISEALDAADLAMDSGYSVVVSERSGETEDPIIADFAVGLGARQIKTGAPVRGERTSKYNRLLYIEERLGNSARYAGEDFRNPTREEAHLNDLQR